MATKKTDLVQRSAELLPDLMLWRRHFHCYPELSFQEKQTSEKVEEVLQSLGAYQIETGVGGYGIIATLRSGEGPVIGLRADMDALPIVEQTGAEYGSRSPSVMHACGHDAHTAILLGAAKILAEDANRGLFQGTVKLIFQPAEENCDQLGETGAMKMLASGKLDDVESIFALHMCPWRETGEIQVHDGPSMANNDDFHLVVKGSGGHGGYPHHVTDPVWISSYILQALYSVNGRKVDPLEVGTISVGQVHAGHANNVIPHSVEIRGTIRSYTEEVREQLVEEIHRVARIVTALGGDYEFTVHKGEPALVNDPLINEVIRQSAKDMKIYERPFGMGSEDFSHMTRKIPGAMFFLGCRLGKGRSLHQSDFDIDEAALPHGVTILTRCVRNLLSQKGGES